MTTRRSSCSSAATAFRRSAYSIAWSWSWIEHGPTTTTSRSSRPCRTAAIAARLPSTRASVSARDRHPLLQQRRRDRADGRRRCGRRRSGSCRACCRASRPRGRAGDRRVASSGSERRRGRSRLSALPPWRKMRPLLPVPHMARYSVVSIDNETIGRGGRSESRGEFESAEAAIGRAKELVDAALLEHFPGAVVGARADGQVHARGQRGADDLRRAATRVPRLSLRAREGDRPVRRTAAGLTAARGLDHGAPAGAWATSIHSAPASSTRRSGAMRSAWCVSPAAGTTTSNWRSETSA